MQRTWADNDLSVAQEDTKSKTKPKKKSIWINDPDQDKEKKINQSIWMNDQRDFSVRVRFLRIPHTIQWFCRNWEDLKISDSFMPLQCLVVPLLCSILWPQLKKKKNIHLDLPVRNVANFFGGWSFPFSYENAHVT